MRREKSRPTRHHRARCARDRNSVLGNQEQAPTCVFGGCRGSRAIGIRASIDAPVETPALYLCRRWKCESRGRGDFRVSHSARISVSRLEAGLYFRSASPLSKRKPVEDFAPSSDAGCREARHVKPATNPREARWEGISEELYDSGTHGAIEGEYVSTGNATPSELLQGKGKASPFTCHPSPSGCFEDML